MTKHDADIWLRKIYRALRNSPEMRFKLDRDLRAVYGTLECSMRNPEQITLSVNPAKKGARGGFMSTVIHECLHLVSDVSESAICKLEKQLFETLTDRQLANLLKRISDKIICYKTR